MLEELGIPYELKMLPFPPRIHARDYLQINPLGTVPAFFDGKMLLTESAAICHYLAARFAPTPLNVEPHEPAFGLYLNWLHFGEATLTFPQTLVLRYSRFERPDRRQPQVVEDYSKWFLGRLRTLDMALSKTEFLCAERFTAADISVGYALLLAQHVTLDRHFPTAISDYWQRLQQREGFLRALATQQRAAHEQGVPEIPAPETQAPY